MEKTVLWLLITVDGLLPRLPAIVRQRLEPKVMQLERAVAQRLIRRLRRDLHDAENRIEQMNEQIKKLSDKSSEDEKD